MKFFIKQNLPLFFNMGFPRAIIEIHLVEKLALTDPILWACGFKKIIKQVFPTLAVI